MLQRISENHFTVILSDSIIIIIKYSLFFLILLTLNFLKMNHLYFTFIAIFFLYRHF